MRPWDRADSKAIRNIERRPLEHYEMVHKRLDVSRGAPLSTVRVFLGRTSSLEM